MMPPDRGRWMAVDYGERRIGLAVSDPTGTIASPAGVDRAPSQASVRRSPRWFVARRRSRRAAIVMGLPLDGEGDDTPRATECRRVAAELDTPHGAAGGARRRAIHHGDRASRDPRHGRSHARPERRRRCARRHRAAAACAPHAVARRSRRGLARRRGRCRRDVARLDRRAADRCRGGHRRDRHAGVSRLADRSVRVIMPRGATLRVAADSLAKAGVVQQRDRVPLLRMLARQRPVDQGGHVRVQARCLVGRACSTSCAAARGSSTRSPFPKGWSLIQIVPLLARVLDVPVDSVQAAVRDTALLHAPRRADADARGLPLPRHVRRSPRGRRPRTAVRVMVERFERVWQPEWNARLQALAMTRHDVMALASIVEKEARLPEERPVIAAVYHNRLKSGDAAAGRSHGAVRARQARRAGAVQGSRGRVAATTPTSTTACRPARSRRPAGRRSSRALYPANVPYTYFVAHPDGHHEFTTNFAAHSVAVRGARVARGIPSPRCDATPRDHPARRRRAAVADAGDSSAGTGRGRGSTVERAADRHHRFASRRHRRARGPRAAAAVFGGATMIQLRLKDETPRDRSSSSRAASQAMVPTSRSSSTIARTSRSPLARPAFTSAWTTSRRHRCAAWSPPGFIIGASVGSEDGSSRAAGADYVGIGPVFATGSKADAGDGDRCSERFAELAQRCALPAVAIGGITSIAWAR